MTNSLCKCLPLYLGCDTNKGRFVGIRKDTLFIQAKEELIEEYDIHDLGRTLFLHLRRLNNLTDEQSNKLIEEGIVIGRPHGYTYSSQGFLYLLSLGVDLFKLINSGLASEIKQ